MYFQIMNGEPLISVVTVCYNSASTIQDTFDSIRSQTYRNIQYIVIDGSSSDGTQEIIESNQDIVDVFISEPDNGIYDAMNKGINLCDGESILLLNSDDWLEDIAIEKLVESQLITNASIVCALANYVEVSGSKILRSMPFNLGTYFRMPLRHETMLVKSYLYDYIGLYDTSLDIIADRDWVHKFFLSGLSIYEIPIPLLNFRVTGISNTRLDKLSAEKCNLLRKYFPFITEAESALINSSKLSCFDLLAIAKNKSDPDFTHACLDLIHDRKTINRKKWGIDSSSLNKFLAECNLPLVSIILPVYNAEKSLNEAIFSVINQGIEDFELIIINDQTPDNSQLIIDKWCLNDDRIKSYTNTQNIGLGATRNKGIGLAKGKYIFHLDPDDVIEKGSLKELMLYADKYDSDMTKGSYIHEQLIMGVPSKGNIVGLAKGTSHVVNTNLKLSPEILNSTEGHWSYLYRSEFARSIKYPEDLKMGQDSIFLVQAIASAKSISITDIVVYHYRANPESAMNTFNSKKVFDAIVWRYRAWHVLKNAKYLHIAQHLMFNYWSFSLLDSIKISSKSKQDKYIINFFKYCFDEAGYDHFRNKKNPRLHEKIDELLKSCSGIKISTVSTQDHGGAGIGSLRRIKALKELGLNVNLLCLINKNKFSFSTQLIVSKRLNGASAANSCDINRKIWQDNVVVRRQDFEGLKANELFSKAKSVIDFRDNINQLSDCDVLHLHWVAGVFDYDNAHLLSNKPIVWTLADMNAFTGGCHYSESCSEYINECRNCPLLGEKHAHLAHQAWKKKKAAYSKLKHLEIICPSEWLASCVKKSSLFKNRPVHVVPNPAPVDEFVLTNKTVARVKLGLDISKRYIVFGADSLNNVRKGGDIFVKALKLLSDKSDIEVITFGSSRLNFPLPSISLGKIDDVRKISLAYSAADVYAFPSREDNAPLTVMESLLCGTPVVGFEVGNVPEIIKHKENGFIASNFSPTSFAEGLMMFLGGPRRTKGASLETIRRSNLCRMAVSEYHDPRQSALRHMGIYENLLKTVP